MTNGANLNKWIVILSSLLAMGTATMGGAIYVDADANGANDGSSWTDAYNYLQDALADAKVNGGDIWVAEGIYKPDANSSNPSGSGDRTATFNLKSGVALYGGFGGWETSREQRNWTTHETILSGGIGAPWEDAYHVLTASGTDSTAILDGFTITGGAAVDPDPNNKGGGGMLNDNSSPTVSNCTFIGNRAAFNFRGGMSNWHSHPNIINCTFSGNSGGMYNYNSNPTVTDCTFSKNQGAGMVNYWSSPTLTNCTFASNSGGKLGDGGMSNGRSNPSLTNCVFIGNSSNFEGGGMYNSGSNPTLTNCVFRGNSANMDGGGMCNFESSPTLINCTFSENRAGIGGGAMYNWYGDPNVINCVFSGNWATWSGGAMVNNNSSSATVINCIFSGNSTSKVGGAMVNAYSGPTVANCTFSGNSAYTLGGAIYNVEGSPIMVNCILWNNWAPEGRQIALRSDSTVDVKYCDVQGGQADIYNDGSGSVNWGSNIDADPRFRREPNHGGDGWGMGGNDDYGNLHLSSGSSCIDAGDPNYVGEPGETDLDGKPRILGGRVDMGAYEFESLPAIEAVVKISPKTLNLQSKGRWITCYIWLPEDYNVADIDPNSILLEDEVEAVRVWLTDEFAVAKFSRRHVQEMLGELETPAEVELVVSGELSDGTIFDGTDTIRVIDAGGGKNNEPPGKAIKQVNRNRKRIRRP